MSVPSIEAKIVVLGSQGVGKTSLVHRYVHHNFAGADGSSVNSTIGASFLTKRVSDVDSGTIVRLQIWDTAGQERFRSISKLYYRGANACILCYDITSPSSFAEVSHWLYELKANLPADTIIHIVGTKADIVTEEPARRKVPFETCVTFAAENIFPSAASAAATASQGGTNVANTPLPTPLNGPAQGAAEKSGGVAGLTGKSVTNLLLGSRSNTATNIHAIDHAPPQQPHYHQHLSAHVQHHGHGLAPAIGSPNSARSSMGFWGQDLGWDSCHEVSASTGEGVEEVFRVITRRLVDQRSARAALEARFLDSGMWPANTPMEERQQYLDAFSAGEAAAAAAQAAAEEGAGYAYANGAHVGSFRLGHGDKRRSWLGLPSFSGEAAGQSGQQGNVGVEGAVQSTGRAKGGRCC